MKVFSLSRSSSVQLWFCSLSQLDDNEHQVDHLKRWLSGDELDKVARYRKKEAKTRALYIRSFLRAILSQYAPISPEQWQFVYGDKGKPALVIDQRIQTGIEFNLSHSGDYLFVGIILSKNEELRLGVDIEYTRARTHIYPILEHHFSSQEVSALLALPEHLQRQRFFDLWALKESYIKATGQGLSTSLKSFGFDLSMVKKESLSILPFVHARQSAIPACSLKGKYENRNIELYRDIPLDIFDNKGDLFVHRQDNQIHWQSCFGRLDTDYRFAVSLGGSATLMTLNALFVEPSQWLLLSQ